MSPFTYITTRFDTRLTTMSSELAPSLTTLATPSPSHLPEPNVPPFLNYLCLAVVGFLVLWILCDWSYSYARSNIFFQASRILERRSLSESEFALPTYRPRADGENELSKRLESRRRSESAAPAYSVEPKSAHWCPDSADVPGA
ncbi:hypothetical protein C8J57DRAFT_1513299 [Mycena rebaudengoi]|nr:hypothetical protein C8J57DRAFT_1525814 [Mycena rebaudengoi]KAJ7263073.1 hypothetical protein C8J57DRAFT_1513299 [Mycena rebaudengoi]